MYDMARNERRQFSLPPDVNEKIDEQPKGNRSAFVAEAVRAFDGEVAE